MDLVAAWHLDCVEHFPFPYVVVSPSQSTTNPIHGKLLCHHRRSHAQYIVTDLWQLSNARGLRSAS